MLMVNMWPARFATHADVAITLDEHGPGDAGNGHWLVPEGYLNARILQGIFHELVLNESQHGISDEGGQVRLQVTLSKSKRAMSCVFVNRSEVTKPEEVTNGFLLRTRRVLEGIGIELSFDMTEKDERDYYVATLLLGPIRAESEGGATVHVEPCWEAG